MIVSDHFEGEKQLFILSLQGIPTGNKKVGRILRPTSLKLLSTI